MRVHVIIAGAKDYAAVGYNLQMALILSYAIALFPVSVIWLFSKPILICFGQDDEIASRASPYLQLLIPSVFMFATRLCIQTWCQAQQIVRPFTVNAAIVAAISIPLTRTLVLQMDYLGGALAATLLMTIQFLLDVSYVYFSGVYKKTWFGFDIRKACRSLKPMLKLSLGSQMMFAGRSITMNQLML